MAGNGEEGTSDYFNHNVDRRLFSPAAFLLPHYAPTCRLKDTLPRKRSVGESLIIPLPFSLHCTCR